MLLWLCKLQAILKGRVVPESPFEMGVLYYREQQYNEDGFFGQDLIDVLEDKNILQFRKRNIKTGLLIDRIFIAPRLTNKEFCQLFRKGAEREMNEQS